MNIEQKTVVIRIRVYVIKIRTLKHNFILNIFNKNILNDKTKDVSSFNEQKHWIKQIIASTNNTWIQRDGWAV